RSGKLRVSVLESGLSLLNRIGSNPNFLAGYESGNSILNNVVRLLLVFNVKRYTKKGKLFKGEIKWKEVNYFFEYFIGNINFLSPREIGWKYRTVNVNLIPFKRRVDGKRETSEDTKGRVNPMGLWSVLERLARYELNGEDSLNQVLVDIIGRDTIGKLRRQNDQVRLEDIVSEEEFENVFTI
ncbi:MAG: hypothetical protein AABY10_00565, partial [Nanoarchaeota archaeon]